MPFARDTTQQCFQTLCALLPSQPIRVGEYVKLNPSLQYIACNVMLSAATKIPPNSGELEALQQRLGNRLYNLPCYFFIGESQCGVVEIARGNLSVGCVRVLVKLHDVREVAIAKESNRTLTITVIIGSLL